jgi:hypothetical protein
MNVLTWIKEMTKEHTNANLDSLEATDILDMMSNRKLLINAATEQYKEMEAYLKENFDLPKKYENEYGEWQLKSRTNFEITDNEKAFIAMGHEEFVEKASISKAKLATSVGAKGVKKALKEGWLIEKAKTFYMSFKAH